MHWLLLATLMVGARPHHAPKRTKPVPKVAATPEAQAQNFFLAGVKAESMSDAEFSSFVRSINSEHLDQWSSRRIYALGQFNQAVLAYPGHWPAHKHLGFLYRDSGGTTQHERLTVLHLATYLALKPDDPDGPRAKKVIDDALRHLVGVFASEPLLARGHMYGILMNKVVNEETINSFHGLLVGMRQFSRREVFGGFAAAALIKPGVFTDDPDLKLPDNLGAEGLWQLSVDAAPLAEPGLDSARDLAAELLRSTNYVPFYVTLMASMHSLMDYLDSKGIPYDPRPLQMLIGESVLQMRICLCNSTGDLKHLKEEYAKYTQLGGVSAQDLWSTRDTTKPLPEFLIPGGVMPEPEKDRDAYDTLRNLLPCPWGAGYIWDAGDPKVYPSETPLALLDISMDQAYRAWNEWSVMVLDATAKKLGVDVNDVLTTDYAKLGTGEITPWSYGPLPVMKRVAQQADDPRWLVAAAN